MTDTLLVYYSLTGLNDALMKKVQSLTNADIYKIETTYNYPKGMYPCWNIVRSWRGISSLPVQGQPLPNVNKLPDIDQSFPNLDQYKNIILAGPVWGWTLSDPLITFLEENNLENKNIKAYWTTVSTDYNYEHDLMSLISNKANYQGGLCIDARLSDDPVELDTALNNLFS